MSDNYITGGQEPPQDYLNLDGALEYIVHQGMGAALLGSTDITYSTGRGDAVYRVAGTLIGGAGGARGRGGDNRAGCVSGDGGTPGRLAP